MDGAALVGGWKAIYDVHTAVFCVGRNSQILAVNMVRRSGLLTELHPGGLRRHCCTVGKTKVMRRVL